MLSMILPACTHIQCMYGMCMYVYVDSTNCIIQMAVIKHTYGTFFPLYSHYVRTLARPPADYVLAAALKSFVSVSELG